MTAFLVDNFRSGAQVRGLQYTANDDLTKDRIKTENAGTVECLPGTLAWKAGYTDMKQLSNDKETWTDV